jgi:hypothetical protein
VTVWAAPQNFNFIIEILYNTHYKKFSTIYLVALLKTVRYPKYSTSLAIGLFKSKFVNICDMIQVKNCDAL